MDHAMHYLGSHPEIEEVLFLTDRDDIGSLVRQICKITKLHKITVCSLSNAAAEIKYSEYMPEQPVCSMTSDELSGFSFSFEVSALYFDFCNDSFPIFGCEELNSSFVIGNLGAGSFDAFSIWEMFRLHTRKMYIASARPDEDPEILNWERDPDSDIELSVILPMYKVAAYLPGCIQSLIAWKAPYVEYLFVDDGSPDNCAEIVLSYAESDPRVKLLQKENGGCASARQMGLEEAKGHYIGFVDPDDYVDESMFLKLFRRAMTGSYEVSYCGYQERYESTGETREIPDVLGEPYSTGTSNPDEVEKLIAYRAIAIWRGIYAKDLLSRNGIHFHTDIPRFDDLPFKVETFACARSVVSVPEYLYYYRMQRPGQDISGDDERLYVHFDIFRHLDEFFRKVNGKRKRDYLLLVKVQTHIWALSKIRNSLAGEYRKMAQQDMKKHTSLLDGILTLRTVASKIDILCFVGLYLNLPNCIRRQIAKIYLMDRN